MESHREDLSDYTEFSQEGKIFSGVQMVKNLSHIDVDSRSLTHLQVKKCFHLII